MKNITIKLFKKPEADLKTFAQVIEALNEGFDTGIVNYEINDRMDLAKLEETLTKQFGTMIEVRSGIQGGCYGARDGSTYSGLTIFAHPRLFPDRWIDSDGDEVVNLYHSLEEHCTSLNHSEVEELEYLLGNCDEHNNTYNSSGHSFLPCLFFDVDFKYWQLNDRVLLAVRYHCGGDPRGNYTREYYYHANDIDDIWSALSPSFLLKEEA